MTRMSVGNPMRARMRQFTRMYPALALVEYDCVNARLGWTVAFASSLGTPILHQPLPLHRWLSLFDRATRKLIWRACATLVAQHSAGQVVELSAVTLADGRTIALTIQIDISYADDQRPTRMSAIVLRLDSPEAAGRRAQQPSARRFVDSTCNTPATGIPDSPSHAMRGRLGAIAAAVEVLRMGVGNDRIRERALEIIDRQTRQLTSLIAATYDGQ